MTQALINNLTNIMQDSKIAAKDSNANDTMLDFAKILDSRTTNQKSSEEKIDINQEKNSDNNNSNMQTDLSNSTSGTLTDEYNSAIQESSAEAVVDLTIIKDIYMDTEDEDSDEEIQKEIQEEISDTITETTDITNEDSTMYKELTTLENPAAALLLQSQQAAKLSCYGEQNQEQGTDETINFRTDRGNTGTNIEFKTTQNLSNDKNFALFDAGIKEKVNVKSEEGTKLSELINEKIIKEINVESVEQDAAQNEFSDLMQRQSPQEQAAKVMIQGDIKYENVIKESFKSAEVKLADITPSKIVEQISKQLEGMHNNSKLNMVLNPGSLGKIHLHIMNTKDGLVAQFTVTTQDTKDLILKGMEGLKGSLLAQGINVDNVTVKFEESDNESTPDWTEQEGSKGGFKHHDAKKEKENEKPFEQMMFEIENSDNLE